ncbi:MAG: MBOAT family protein, partial [Muribaculaceae bacterium]|nr:MBOAT family protein [Muribaculaceae bacterium]
MPALIVCYRIAAVFDRKTSGGKTRNLTWRNSVLIAFSLLFYAWGEPVYVFLMIGCVIMNYLLGLWIDRCRRRFFRRFALTAGILLNVATLGVFKYAGFVCVELARFGIHLPVPDISLPIGISFYIFQSISYLTDVYRTHAAAQRRFSGLLLYISMFPQLVAGPIVRYSTVAREIYDRTVTRRDIADGIFRFLIGLGKKVIIANQMSEIADSFLTDNLASLSTLGAWVGLLAFTLQIYFDFSGYSD